MIRGFASESVYRLGRALPIARSHFLLRHSVLKRICVVSEF